MVEIRYVRYRWGDPKMSFVVAEPCVMCRYTDCVEVCPVDCFYEGENFLAINPDECIDCAACEPECPVEAIFPEDDLPDKWAEYKDLNEKFAAEWPNITEKKGELDTAEEYKEIEEKRDKLSEAPQS